MMKGFLLLAGLALAGCSTGISQNDRFVGMAGPVGEFTLPMHSMAERRFEGVVQQRYDFSCGSAALATLLRFHYGFDVREDMAFRGMWARGDRDQIRRLGFSLLDMKRWLASRGLNADGYRVQLKEVEAAAVPGIALVSIRNYRHFVVIKGIREDEVLLGDPSSGLKVMPRKAFEAAWNGIYFVLAQDQAPAKQSFNSRMQWSAFARAPSAGRFTDPLSLQALSLAAPFYGDIS
jgi:predicted double-glycine peptidase